MFMWKIWLCSFVLCVSGDEATDAMLQMFTDMGSRLISLENRVKFLENKVITSAKYLYQLFNLFY